MNIKKYKIGGIGLKKKIRNIGLVLFIFIVIILIIINRYGPTVGTQFGKPVYILPPSPQRYGEIAIELIDKNGYYSTSEKWNIHKEKALEEMEKVSDYKDTYPIIAESLKVAGGKHSFFMSASIREKHLSQYQSMPKIEKIDNILHVYLPEIANAQEYGKEYAEIVLKGLQDNSNVKGIVLDLQGNTGGAMGPMIAAVSPLLPDGEVLLFSYGNYDTPVVLENGIISVGRTQVNTEVTPFKLDVPLAILTNSLTASSAEATLMSLMTLDNIKTFGQSTAGYASGNVTFELYDGAVIILTSAYNKTIDGQIFGDNPIPVNVKTDHPLEEAINWLNSL